MAKKPWMTKIDIFTNLLHGKVNNPVQYGPKNCKKLETSRLFSLEMVNVNQELANAKSCPV